VGSTLLAALHPHQLRQSAGFEDAAWARWGSFAVYGVKLHLLCATNRVPLSYELTAANAAEVLLVRELLDGAGLPADGTARRLLGDLAYRSEKLREELAASGVLLATERADRRPAVRQHVEVCFAALKRTFGLGQTLAKTLVGARDEDRGQGHCPHLRLLRQPPLGQAARPHQGSVSIERFS